METLLLVALKVRPTARAGSKKEKSINTPSRWQCVRVASRFGDIAGGPIWPRGRECQHCGLESEE